VTGRSTSSFGSAKDQLLSLQPLGIWWWKPIDGRKRVTPNSHFKELLGALNSAGAKYLIVGGYAVMLYTEPRYTKDLDIWIEGERRELTKSLPSSGPVQPLAGINQEDFAKEDLIYQLGVAPSRVDVMTSLSGLEDLLKNKRATGRLADLADCERLADTRKPE